MSTQTIQTAPPISASPGSIRFRGRSGKALLRLILIVLGIGVALGLCEIVMRVFQLGHTRTVVLYNNKIYKLPPHTTVLNHYENRNVFETNNLGFHDRERQTANDNYRILFIGDSFVEGRQVNTESLFTMRLEKKLSDDGYKMEAINGGVPGTGTAYQYSLWKEFFEPSVKVDHLVLCFFLGNDLVDNNSDLVDPALVGNVNAFYVDSQGNILTNRRQPGLFKSSVNSVRDHSILFDTLYEASFQVKRSMQTESDQNGGKEDGRIDGSDAWRRSEQGTIALIKRWKAEVNEKKIPFDVVVIDRPGKVYNKYESEFVDRLLTTCTAEQIDCLRLKLTADPFETYSFDGASLGHFNYRGHELAAQELYGFLKAHHPAIFNLHSR